MTETPAARRAMSRQGGVAETLGGGAPARLKPASAKAGRVPGAAVPAAPMANLGFLVSELSRLFKRRFAQHGRMQGLPITRLQASLLVRLSQAEGCSQATLAGALDVEPITLVRLVDRLQQLDLIERRHDPADRRIRTLWLKPAAGAMLQQIRAISGAVRAEGLVGFTAEEETVLIAGLRRLHANMSSIATGSEDDGGEDDGRAVD